MEKTDQTLDQVDRMYRELDEAETGQKRNDAKKAWKIVGNAAFAIAVILLVFALIWIQIAKENGKTPEIFGYSLSYVKTGSMEPALPVSSIILSKKVKDTTALEIGDVITFENPDGVPVTHRIHDKVTIDGVIFYVTKGDNNDNPDRDYVPQDKIISKMVMKLF